MSEFWLLLGNFWVVIWVHLLVDWWDTWYQGVMDFLFVLVSE
jgi:hypothetical protein